jgi:hypothetical protein
MSLKDLDILFKVNQKDDISTYSRIAFTNQQVKQISLTKKYEIRFDTTLGSPIDELKFNKNVAREYYILNFLQNKCKFVIKGIKNIQFNIDKSNIFSRRVSVNVSYSIDDQNTKVLTNSTFKFLVK